MISPSNLKNKPEANEAAAAPVILHSKEVESVKAIPANPFDFIWNTDDILMPKSEENGANTSSLVRSKSTLTSVKKARVVPTEIHLFDQKFQSREASSTNFLKSLDSTSFPVVSEETDDDEFSTKKSHKKKNKPKQAFMF